MKIGPCPRCERKVRLEDRFVEVGWATCRACGHTFDFWDWSENQHQKAVPVHKPRAVRVKGLPKPETGDAAHALAYRQNAQPAERVLEIAFPRHPKPVQVVFWVGASAIPLSTLALVVAYPYAVLAWTLAAGLAGLLAWFASSRKTTLSLRDGRLRVQGSMGVSIEPQCRTNDLSLSKIRRVFVSRGKTPGEVVPELYLLRAIVDGQEGPFVTLAECRQKNEALWIKQELERALKLSHQPVRGELRPEATIAKSDR